MEKKNNCMRVEFSTILWAVLAILLCAAPDLHADETVPAGETWNIDYDVTGSDLTGALWVLGTANVLPGAVVTDGLYVQTAGTSYISGGTITPFVSVSLDAAGMTVYGTGFKVDGNPVAYGEVTLLLGMGTLTGYYGDESDINLLIYSDIPINLAAPPAGGDSITVNIEKAKVSWDHSDIHVEGKLYLPQGFWMDNLNPVGSAGVEVVTFADDIVADQIIAFDMKGKDGKKWEYKDKENIDDGPIKEFKIDWKGAKFDYKGDEGLHIHTHFIGGTETTLCIHCDHISGAFTVTINGTTIAYDEDRNITMYVKDVEYEPQPQKDDNSHVHFPLPFQLTSDMTVEVSGTAEPIFVEDYYKEGIAKFKLVSAFDSSQGPGTSQDKLKCVISLGDMIAGSDLIEAWTKQDHKHWEYK